MSKKNKKQDEFIQRQQSDYTKPEEFKILFFTSGTTSNAKGVMLNNRNLAENINAVSAYVKLYPIDMLYRSFRNNI